VAKYALEIDASTARLEAPEIRYAHDKTTIAKRLTIITVRSR
jgi:hypothetical protein